MLATVNRIECSASSIGHLFHKAALASQAIIDAIPEDANARDEADMIGSAIAPVDELAHMILRNQNGRAAGAIRLRALAWLDGCYWATAEGTA